MNQVDLCVALKQRVKSAFSRFPFCWDVFIFFLAQLLRDAYSQEVHLAPCNWLDTKFEQATIKDWSIQLEQRFSLLIRAQEERGFSEQGQACVKIGYLFDGAREGPFLYSYVLNCLKF